MLLSLLGPAITLSLVGGGLFYGRGFLRMVWTFINEGIPTAWSDHVTPNRYYQAFRTAFWIAIVFPVGGGLLAIGAARFVDTGIAQAMLFIAIVPSLAIFATLLFLADVLTSIVEFLLPADKTSEQAMRDFYEGFTNYVWVGLAWESFIALLLIVAGIYATLWVLALCGFAMLVYFIVARAYNIKVKWAPSVMMNTSMAVFLIAVTIFAGVLFPITRPYVMRAGIPVGSFVHKGVVDAGAFTEIERAYYERRRTLCNDGVEKLKEGIQNLALKQGQLPLADLRGQLAKLKSLEKECL